MGFLRNTRGETLPLWATLKLVSQGKIRTTNTHGNVLFLNVIRHRAYYRGIITPRSQEILVSCVTAMRLAWIFFLGNPLSNRLKMSGKFQRVIECKTVTINGARLVEM